MKTKVFIEIVHRETGEVFSVEAVAQFFKYGEQFVIHRKLTPQIHGLKMPKWVCSHAKTGCAVGCGDTRAQARETAEFQIEMNGEHGLRKAIRSVNRQLGRKRK